MHLSEGSLYIHIYIIPGLALILFSIIFAVIITIPMHVAFVCPSASSPPLICLFIEVYFLASTSLPLVYVHSKCRRVIVAFVCW